MPVPARPKIYHIVHADRLPSIVADRFIWSDAETLRRDCGGTTIGMSRIKQRRLTELKLDCHRNLFVGQCTPFYFCPRSVMLFLIHRRNEDLAYKGGQEPIVHLEFDFYEAIEWAARKERRWAFTLSNAGAYYFEDRADVDDLGDIDWDAVAARQWSGNGIPRSVKEGKQAEFLVERSFPWRLVERIGVHSRRTFQAATDAIRRSEHQPPIEIKPEWYY